MDKFKIAFILTLIAYILFASVVLKYLNECNSQLNPISSVAVFDELNMNNNNSQSDYDEQQTSQEFEEKRLRLLQSIFNANNYIDVELISMQNQDHSNVNQRAKINSILKSFRERTRYFF